MGYGFAAMLVPDDLRYSDDHQWVRDEGELWRVGITAFAQDALGEVTMVQVANPNEPISAGDEMGEIEAFKAMTDLYMPVDAVIIEHNRSLHDTPTAVNADPYGNGWLCIVRPATRADLAKLLDADGYRELIGQTNG